MIYVFFFLPKHWSWLFYVYVFCTGCSFCFQHTWSHVFWPTWRSGPRNILSAIFFSHMKVLPDIHCVKAIRFCDILKWKGVPRQKKYQRILWKPPTIHLATESFLFLCSSSLPWLFFYPHTYCTIKIFFAHLDRNFPQKYRYDKRSSKWLSATNDLSLFSSQN